ncbi:MAG: peptide deformylase [Bacteroidales bacterium]|nr:peptide deformylase [Bacteroidales bacterium]
MKRFLNFIFLLLFFAISCNTAKFSLRERRILKKEYEKNIMPLMLVSNKKDSVILYKRSNFFDADSTDRKLNKLVNLMYYTCIDPLNPGVGIAAPQVGINKRIIWVQRFDKEKNPFEVYFNTEILYFSSSKSEGWEGCLSVPGYRGLVSRSDTVILKYDTFDKKNYIDTINGFTAVIFQHEIDHLEGILYTDRISDKTKIFTEEEYKSLNKGKKK